MCVYTHKTQCYENGVALFLYQFVDLSWVVNMANMIHAIPRCVRVLQLNFFRLNEILITCQQWNESITHSPEIVEKLCFININDGSM